MPRLSPERRSAIEWLESNADDWTPRTTKDGKNRVEEYREERGVKPVLCELVEQALDLLVGEVEFRPLGSMFITPWIQREGAALIRDGWNPGDKIYPKVKQP